MASIDKLIWTVLINTACVPFEIGEVLFIYEFHVIALKVLEGFDLPCNSVGKLYNIIFCPWSLIIIGKITLQPEERKE